MHGYFIRVSLAYCLWSNIAVTFQEKVAIAVYRM